jgi:hypothetical protein
MEHVESLLSQIDYVGQITFTGGEPSLNPQCLMETLELCKKHKVEVGSFYVVTNGANIPEEFVVACLKWFAYCEEKDSCGVNLSNDYFHDVEGRYDTALLEGLSFFSKRNREDGEANYQDLIIDGNAEENMYPGEPPKDVDMDELDDFASEELYLNCNGHIVVGCDWSYRRQEDNILCRVDCLAHTLKRMEKKEYA